jgi:helix-turn-helix protein
MTTPSPEGSSGDLTANDPTAKVTADVIRAAMALAARDVDLGLITPEQIESIPRTRFAAVERKKIAEALSAQGMSKRAIAKATGVSHQTIARDLDGPNGPENGPNGPSEGDGNEKPKLNAVGKPYGPQYDPNYKRRHRAPSISRLYAPPPLRAPYVGDERKPIAVQVPQVDDTRDPPGCPTEVEAETSDQETLFEQARQLLKAMTAETRRKFFAYIEGNFCVGSGNALAEGNGAESAAAARPSADPAT